MPSTLLFATNNQGRVYALSTGNSAWREFLYLGLEFKKVSAVPHFLWAIGGDRQVYVHVHGLDIPIRVREESFENERWLPIGGFSSQMLPTDRPHFSSIDGLVNRTIDKIHLPSMAWQWEGEWTIECSLEGQPLDHHGWSYAIDFPAKYHAEKKWNSCVRRRKWVRYRRYSALNSWCAVAPLHKDPTEEPFIDVAIGGNNIPAATQGNLIVWAVTAHGRVMLRTGVTTNSPEGLRWTAISTPSGCGEVCQISVGPTGLVWAVLYNGRVIVRSGVTKDSLSGESWLEVKPPPGNGIKITQVSVGTNSVWCVTNDNHVWFRRGVQGQTAGISEDSAIGSGWVEMVGSISMVSVAPNDQVFAVGSEDRALYFRSGVSPTDLTGKKWRLVQCPMQLSRTSSSMSLWSRRSGSDSPGQKHRSLSSLFKEKARVETSAIIENDVETSCSAPTQNPRHKPELWQKPINSPPQTSSQLAQQSVQQVHQLPSQQPPPTQMGSLNEKVVLRQKIIALEQQAASSAPTPHIHESKHRHHHYETQLKNPRAWSPVRSVGSMVGTEAHPETDPTVFDPADSQSIRDSGVFGGMEDDDHGGSQYWAECDILWTCCSAGAVTVDPTQLPNWFSDVTTSAQTELSQPWRLKILEDLKTRIDSSELEHIDKYEKAVEKSSWVKSGEAKVAKPFGPFEECLIELEWVSSNNAGLDSGTLTILNPDGVTTKMQFSLSEITCICCCSEPGLPRFVIHAPRLPAPGSSPIKLQFSGDTDLEDWLSHLTSVCCQINEVQGRPSSNSIWLTTKLGDVLVFDPTNIKSAQYQQIDTTTTTTTTTNSKIDHLYQQEIDVSAADTPYSNLLFNGMHCGTCLEISGCVYDDADQIRFDLQCHPALIVKHKVEKYRRVAFHINPRFNERVVVLNTMDNSEWLTEKRIKEMAFSPGAQFKLLIRSEAEGFRVFVNDVEFCSYKHRLSPQSVNSLYVSGRVKLFKIYYKCPSVILSLNDIFWRQMGGHLRAVESCAAGVTWGIGYDNTAWVFTGGWGGAFMKGLESSSSGINPMTDTHNLYIYENQRWNPVSGYTSHGFPSDRHSWSDVTGKHKRSKEHSKLLSIHWQWISDWLVDFHTPGGVDRDGWQYAIDFPASYHGKKQFTDCVRRRRWYRKSRLTTSGPWHELGNTKICDVSLQVQPEPAQVSRNSSESSPIKEIDLSINVWAIAANGDALMRRGVSQLSPFGLSWDHIATNQPLCSISCGPDQKIWAIGKNGCAFYRYGITQENPHGNAWQTVEPPSGILFKVISVGKMGIWALDTTGRLAVRREITNIFPEGSHWQILQNLPNDPPHSESTIGFKAISVGATEVWAISNSGHVCKRCGISTDNPAGTGWNLGIPGNFQQITVNGWV